MKSPKPQRFCRNTAQLLTADACHQGSDSLLLIRTYTDSPIDGTFTLSMPQLLSRMTARWRHEGRALSQELRGDLLAVPVRPTEPNERYDSQNGCGSI